MANNCTTVGSHRDRGEILDLKSDGAKSQFHIPIEQLDGFCSFFEVTRFFSDFLKNLIFCIFSQKIHILLNKSIFEPFQLLNGHTLPLKVINNNYQYIIREYAAIVRIVEVGVPGRVMMKSLIRIEIICNYKNFWCKT